MASVGVTVTIRSRLKSQERALESVISDLVHQAAEDIRDKAREKMTLPKTGRPYKGYIASAPGQAPAIRPFPLYPTGGELYASITTFDAGPNTAYVFVHEGTAGYLEYGTRHMKPRPFVRPSVREVASGIRVEAPVKVRYALDRAGWDR